MTIKIPHSKVKFFTELIKQLGFEVTEEVDIPDKHKAIVRGRIKKFNQNPKRLLDWGQIQG